MQVNLEGDPSSSASGDLQDNLKNEKVIIKTNQIRK
jgi:hypothetical protein